MTDTSPCDDPLWFFPDLMSPVHQDLQRRGFETCPKCGVFLDWGPRAAVTDPAPVYDYEFTPWPEHGQWAPEVFDWFRSMNQAVNRWVMPFTETQWARFSASMEVHGITLREVERHDPKAAGDQ